MMLAFPGDGLAHYFQSFISVSFLTDNRYPHLLLDSRLSKIGDEFFSSR